MFPPLFSVFHGCRGFSVVLLCLYLFFSPVNNQQLLRDVGKANRKLPYAPLVFCRRSIGFDVQIARLIGSLEWNSDVGEKSTELLTFIKKVWAVNFYWLANEVRHKGVLLQQL